MVLRGLVYDDGVSSHGLVLGSVLEWKGSIWGSMKRVYVDKRYQIPNTKPRHTYSLPNMQHRLYGAKPSRLIDWSQLIHRNRTLRSATLL